MSKNSVVYDVAKALARLKDERGLSAAQIGRMAKISPRTVGNFLAPEGRATLQSDKIASGKLGELEMICRKVFGIQVRDLLTMAPHSYKTAHEAAAALVGIERAMPARPCW